MNHSFWKNYILKWEKSRYDSFFSKFIYLNLHKRQEYTRNLIQLLPPNTKILELGCGSGRLLENFGDLKDLNYLGIDFSQEAIAQAKKKYANYTNLKWQCLALSDIKDLEADVVISNGLQDWTEASDWLSFQKKNKTKLHFHSFSIKKKSWLTDLHSTFSKALQFKNKISYTPKKFTNSDIFARFDSIEKLNVLTQPHLGICGFVHNLPPGLEKNILLSTSSVKTFFSQKHKPKLIEKIFKQHELKAVQKTLLNLENCQVLEIGSGFGFYTKHLLQHNPQQVFALDPYVKTDKYIQSEKLVFKNISIEALSANQLYDKIFCLGVFEFLKDPDLAVQKIIQQLKNSGEAIILLPKAKGLIFFIYKAYHAFKNKIKLTNYHFSQIQKHPYVEIKVFSAGLLNDLVILRKKGLSQ